MKKIILIGLLIIGIVLISGCVQEEAPPVEVKGCEVKEDCQDKTCFAKACIDNICSYLEIVPCYRESPICGNEICEYGESYQECSDCPDCDDEDQCTEDSFDYEQQKCVNDEIVSCLDCDDEDQCTEDSFDYEQQKCVNEEIIPCCGNEICEPESSESCIIVKYGQFSICPDDCTDCEDTPVGCFFSICPDDCPTCTDTHVGCFRMECLDRETYLTCPQDCPTPKELLEENIPEIKDYPKFEQVVLDLHSSGGISDLCRVEDDVGRVCYNQKMRGEKEFNDPEMKYIKSLFEIFKLKTSLHQADEEVLAYLVTNTIEPHIDLSKHYAMDMEYFVEELIPLANDITKGSSGEMESIEKIVSWVRENIKINWLARDIDNTPKGILEKKEVTVHCDYWATLITALSRASGIPAREVGGSSASRPGGHAWTEAYLDGKWIMVDSTGALEESPEEKNWFHSIWAYDPLNDRVMNVALSYNTEILNLIIEHTKESVGETSAVKQAEEIFTQYKKETDLAKRYTYAQDIMEISISEIIAKEEGYESKDIKVLSLWDWDKLTKEEAFLNELEKAKVISIYDITSELQGGIIYKGSGPGEFPLEKIDTVIPEIKQLFQEKIYFFFAHYQPACDPSGPLSDAVSINLFSPEDVDTLETAYQTLFTGTREFLKKFVTEIVSVVSKEKDSTTFYLPEYIREGTEYSIVTVGNWDFENTAHNIDFEIQSMIKIQDIMMIFLAGQRAVVAPTRDLPWADFNNLKLINKEGKVYADPEIYRNPRPDPDCVIGPPYKDAANGIFIIPGQTIEIYREDDIVIIKGDITTEQIVVS